ncbi:MAG: [acyl-carrier-protein] S-malonyltransferase [Bacillota bacterium]|nr:MAG: [acyl-carrier-protein] S-malonyltransferase [Bacillota bacterium]
MGKLGIVFAGQGSQYVGMGLDFTKHREETQEKLIKASQILGYDVEKILLSEQGEMNQTVYTQPLMLLATIFAFDELKKLNVHIDGVLGFSLGEYSAYYAAEVFSYEELLKIVQQRAIFMDQCAKENHGKMAAIIGLEPAIIEDICASIQEGLVVCANYNSMIQTVISGDEKAVELACEKCKEKGAKRAMILNVSGAFHSPLMKKAGENLTDYLKDITYGNPIYPIYMNTTSQPLDIKKLKTEMEKQIYSPVLFSQSIKHMEENGFTHFIEVGPGTVLSGLIKKINVNLEVINLSKIDDLENLKGWLNTHGFIK